MIANVTNYFRECYLNDNKSTSIVNIFSSDVENLYLIPDKEEIVGGNMPYYPITEEYTQGLQQVLSIYGKEKELCYFSFLLLGVDEVFNRKRKIVAPLYLFPAYVDNDDGLSHLVVEKQNQRFNSEILRSLYNQEGRKEDFNEVISEHFIDLDNYKSLGFLLDKYFKDIDSTWLIDFPNLFNQKKIKNLMAPSQLKKREGFIVVPASGIAIISKSGEALSTLNELGEIAGGEEFSSSMKQLLLNEKVEPGPFTSGKVPNILSKAQNMAVEAASKYPLSLIVGPPGTGKSYTIATLAIEHFSKGKSVLIVSRTDKAVDVVANKIENELNLKNVVIRAGRSQYLRDLKTSLQDILHGVNLVDPDDRGSLEYLSIKIRQLEEKVDGLEATFLECARFERKWGMFLSGKDSKGKFFKRLKTIYIKRKSKKLAPAWELIQDMESSLSQLERKIRVYITQCFELRKSHMAHSHRKQLQLLLQALKARTGMSKENIFGQINFRVMLQAFPIWLVNMKDIGKALPLKSELFDLAIIDEATQCDIASSLPIFQRAKHVVVTGDPKQLRHISFLSGAVQNKLQEKHGVVRSGLGNKEVFNYRKSSVLDMVSSKITEQNQVSFLNEHYRSTPAIIRYSNQVIYNNALHVMTEKPDIPYNQGLELKHCKGKRDEKGVNEEEALVILEEIRDIASRERGFEQSNCQSIGILSPFRNQVEHLKKLCETELDTAIIRKHDILIGTAYEFQGEERDVMMISLSLDDDSHAMAYHHMNKPDVFNVSITRARSKQVIYCSFDFNRLPSGNLVKGYLSQISADLKKDVAQKVNKDEFLNDVSEVLSGHDIKVWKAYQIAGLKVDIVLQTNDKNYGIDLIGYPGEFEDAFTIERYKILRRAKLPIMPLPYSSWIFKREECEKAILDFISTS